MSDPVLIDDPRVLAMPIEECGEPLVDLRERHLLTSSEIPGYGRVESDVETRLCCREEVARRLVEADRALPEGVRLLVWEGHRPVALQAAYWEEAVETLRERHPDWSEEKLARENAKLVAPPWEAPPHSTGGALDVTLAGESGEELEMGSPLNDSGPLAHTLAEGVSEEGREHRKLLLSAMEGAGFANYGYEWWHYSYGDRYWAFTKGRPAAIYGPV